MATRGTQTAQPADEDDGALDTLARPEGTQQDRKDGGRALSADEFEIIELDDDGKAPADRKGAADTAEHQEGDLAEDREDAQAGKGDENYRGPSREDEEREAQALGISRTTLKKRKRNDRFRKRGEELTRVKAELAARDARIAQLEGKFEKFEPRLDEYDAGRQRDQVRQLDSDIAQAEKDMAAAEDAVVAAMESNDGAAWKRANRIQQEAFVKRERLFAQKQNLEATAKAPRTEQTRTEASPTTQQQQTPRAISPVAQSYANDFLTAHPWINPKGVDRDSRTAIFWDRELQLDGSDPTTAEHWERLEDKLAEVIPDRFKDDDDGESRPAPKAKTNGNGNGHAQQRQESTTRRGPMTTGASENSSDRNSGRKQVRLTQERLKALQQAGVMDEDRKVVDPVKFQRLVKYYEQHDRASGAV